MQTLFKKRKLIKKIIALSSAALFIYFFILFGINQKINLYDEGLMAYGAIRVVNGGVPYADFWTCYGPAQFYVLAFIFKYFGASLIVMRICYQLIGCLLLAMIYVIVKKISNRKLAIGALLASAIILVASYRFTPFSMVQFSALLFSLLSCFFLLNFLSNKRKIWIILSGLSVAVTVLFRHDVGFYTFASQLIVIFAVFFLDTPRSELPVPHIVFGNFKTLLFYLLSIIVILFPVCVYFFCKVELKELVYDLIIYPTKIYPRMRALPYPSPLLFLMPIFYGNFSFGRCLNLFFIEAQCYFPLITCAAVFFVLLNQFRLRIKNKMQRIKWEGLLFALLGLFFFKYSSVRCDFTHLLPMLFISIIQFFFIVYEFRRNKIIASVFLIIFSILCYSILSTMGWYVIKDTFLRYRHMTFFDMKRARGIPIDNRSTDYIDYQNAVNYIHNNTLGSEKIFVGNIRHDRTAINDVMFYFLSERDSATKYYDLHPGIVTESEMQKKVISDIERQGVRFIVLWDIDVLEPNESSKSSGVFLLDDFIKHKFKLLRSFGKYSIYSRQ